MAAQPSVSASSPQHSSPEPSPKRRKLSPPSRPDSADPHQHDNENASSADELSPEYRRKTSTRTSKARSLKTLPSRARGRPRKSTSQDEKQTSDPPPQSPTEQQPNHPGPSPSPVPAPAPTNPDTSADELDHTHLRVPKHRFHSHASPSASRPSTSHSHASSSPSPSTSSQPSSPFAAATPSSQLSHTYNPTTTNHPLSPTHPSASPPINYKPRLILRGHSLSVTCVRFSPDGNWLASCSSDATLKIWNAHTGAHHHTHRAALAGASTLAWAPSSNLLALGSDDLAIHLFSLSSLSVPRQSPLTGHSNYILSVAFSPKGNILASGSQDEALYLWDVRTARRLRMLPAHGDPVTSVAFSHDGTLVVSCAADGVIRIWDTASGQCLRTFFGEETPAVGAVRFAPNSKYVAAWMLDSSVRLWDYKGGEGGSFSAGARCVKTYEGHVNVKFSISGCFGAYDVARVAEGDENEEEGEGSELGQAQQRALIVAPSEDGRILLWDVVTKDILQELGGVHQHKGTVFAVDAHPTQKLLASCGADHTIRIWAG